MLQVMERVYMCLSGPGTPRLAASMPGPLPKPNGVTMTGMHVLQDVIWIKAESVVGAHAVGWVMLSPS